MHIEPHVLKTCLLTALTMTGPMSKPLKLLRSTASTNLTQASFAALGIEQLDRFDLGFWPWYLPTAGRWGELC